MYLLNMQQIVRLSAAYFFQRICKYEESVYGVLALLLRPIKAMSIWNRF